MSTPTTTAGESLQADSVRIVDLRLLSQSELYALSRCAPSPTFCCDDVVIPKIDRSVFNESAGSRKQTYSRLRLAPPSSSSGLRPTDDGNNTANSDPENAQIVSMLKKLFMPNADPLLNSGELIDVPVDSAPQELVSRRNR